MTPASSDIMPAPPAGVTDRPALPPQPAGPPKTGWTLSWPTIIKLAVTAVVVVLYYTFRKELVELALSPFQRFIRSAVPESPGYLYYLTTFAKSFVEAMPAWLAAALLFSLIYLWRKELAKAKPWHPPLLILSILIMGDAAYSILELHHRQLVLPLGSGISIPYAYTPTFFAILATILTELILGRFFYGKWPHLASAFISGISAGILVKSPYLWPFVLCGMVSITSKYVLRIGERHLWNPTNFGVTMLLFLAPQYVASLSIEAGNEFWAALVIWILGGMILYRLGLWYVPAAFVAAFIPLALFRAWVSGHPFLTEVAPITSPMFQLYIFFMITDPKTITKRKWNRVLVAVLVAVAETFYRVVFRDVHSLYHALFTVGPIANLTEMAYDAYFAKKQPAPEAAPANGVALAKA